MENETIQDVRIENSVASYQEHKAFFKSGKTRPLSFRKEALRRLYDTLKKYEKEVLDAIRQDMGRNTFEAFGGDVGVVYKEISYTISNLKRWMQSEKRTTPLSLQPASSKIIYEPLGVVLVIAPWNYPVNLTLIPLAAAIAAGNCVMVKPSEISSSSEKIVEKIIREAFQRGHVSVLTGEGAALIPPLLDAVRFDHIFYTGSGLVGRSIAVQAAKKLIPITLELGGKSPAIIDRDANLELAARKIVWSKFFNCGQTCIATDYVLVPNDLYEEFIELAKKNILNFYGTNPKGNPTYGRIISKSRAIKLQTFLTQGTILYGGDIDLEKKYIGPTLLGDITLEDSVMQEEIFGPILPVLRYENLDEAIGIIQGNPTPLSLYIFTNNRETEKVVLEKVSFGGCIINFALVHFTNQYLPFGGVGTSGYGRTHGKEGFDLFSNRKSIMRYPNWFDNPIVYPPFSSWKEKLVRYFLK